MNYAETMEFCLGSLREEERSLVRFRDMRAVEGLPLGRVDKVLSDTRKAIFEITDNYFYKYRSVGITTMLGVEDLSNRRLWEPE